MIRAYCLWCRDRFASEDDGHMFCSEACVDAWLTAPAAERDWDFERWADDRARRTPRRRKPRVHHISLASVSASYQRALARRRVSA